jgi:hypothetical protein
MFRQKSDNFSYFPWIHSEAIILSARFQSKAHKVMPFAIIPFIFQLKC